MTVGTIITYLETLWLNEDDYTFKQSPLKYIVLFSPVGIAKVKSSQIRDKLCVNLLFVICYWWAVAFEWFAEMVDFMKSVAKLGVELSVEERNLLSVAYKNVIGAQRSAWRIISSIEQKEENKGESSTRLQQTKEYRLAVSFLFLVLLSW